MLKVYLSSFCVLIVSCLFAQSTSNFIIVDQFGYRPVSEKIAVIKNPQTGFDASSSFTPGTSYALVDASDDQQVFTAAPVAWNGGATDVSSGDQAWWFDFSSYEVGGTYYVLDIQNNVKSFDFEISETVYEDVLKQAVRTFFYQRVGFAKEAPYAEPGWEDGISHMGDGQDPNARIYNDSSDPSTERDVSGGWYDAGDLNKYTPWTANYVIDMLLGYTDNPEAWSDDYNLPESGNGVADILDEAKWGLEHLLRLQEPDGSLWSVVDEAHTSPPSAATTKTEYGDVNTISALKASSAFAYGAKVFRGIGQTSFASQLEAAAELSWAWAQANPNIVWRNNDAAYNSTGVGSGQQEVDDYGRLAARVQAAAFLFDLTGNTTYRDAFDAEYEEVHLIPWYFAYPFERGNQETLLFYSQTPSATSGVASTIRSRYSSAMNGDENFTAVDDEKDPYLAHLKDYGWGSNNTKSNKGLMFTNYIEYDINATLNDKARRAAERYIHYIHGVNPLNFTYLTNMYNYGGDNCANQIYHTWFTDGSAKWDEVGVSTYGPPPGFLAGGANPSYNRDGCCPGSCGGSANNAVCSSESLEPPMNQPDQKSYKDFNTNWPLNSWEVTENSCGYQISYIRLLSHFVTQNKVINATPELSSIEIAPFNLYPNPSQGSVTVKANNHGATLLELRTSLGELITTATFSDQESFDWSGLTAGSYLIKLTQDQEVKSYMWVKQ